MPDPVLTSLLCLWEAVFAPALTRPSFKNLLVVLIGWVRTVAPKHAITEALVAAAVSALRHHEAFYRLFSRGTWDPDHVGFWLMQRLLKWIGDSPIRIVIDDTLAHGKGARIFGIGSHVDAVRSTRRYRVLAFGHCWVVLAVLIKVPFSSRAWALPVLLRLYRNKKECKRNDGDYGKKTEFAREMLEVFCRWVPDRRIELAVDAGFCNDTITRGLPKRVVLFGAMRPDAVLTAEPPPHVGPGRPRVRGDVLPKPEALAKDASTPWKTCEARVYGRTITMRYKEMLAQWYRACGTGLLRIVIVETTKGSLPFRVFFCTDPLVEARAIAETYAGRWGIEVLFRDLKQLLGFGDSAARTAAAVLRMAPSVALLYSTLVLWLAEGAYVHPIATPPERPWYPDKQGLSFADVLRAARGALKNTNVLDLGSYFDNLQNPRATKKPPGNPAIDIAA